MADDGFQVLLVFFGPAHVLAWHSAQVPGSAGDGSAGPRGCGRREPRPLPGDQRFGRPDDNAISPLNLGGSPGSHHWRPQGQLPPVLGLAQPKRWRPNRPPASPSPSRPKAEPADPLRSPGTTSRASTRPSRTPESAEASAHVLRKPCPSRSSSPAWEASGLLGSGLGTPLGPRRALRPPAHRSWSLGPPEMPRPAREAIALHQKKRCPSNSSSSLPREAAASLSCRAQTWRRAAQVLGSSTLLPGSPRPSDPPEGASDQAGALLLRRLCHLSLMEPPEGKAAHPPGSPELSQRASVAASSRQSRPRVRPSSLPPRTSPPSGSQAPSAAHPERLNDLLHLPQAAAPGWRSPDPRSRLAAPPSGSTTLPSTWTAPQWRLTTRPSRSPEPQLRESEQRERDPQLREQQPRWREPTPYTDGWTKLWPQPGEYDCQKTDGKTDGRDGNLGKRDDRSSDAHRAGAAAATHAEKPLHLRGLCDEETVSQAMRDRPVGFRLVGGGVRVQARGGLIQAGKETFWAACPWPSWSPQEAVTVRNAPSRPEALESSSVVLECPWEKGSPISIFLKRKLPRPAPPPATLALRVSPPPTTRFRRKFELKKPTHGLCGKRWPAAGLGCVRPPGPLVVPQSGAQIGDPAGWFTADRSLRPPQQQDEPRAPRGLRATLTLPLQRGTTQGHGRARGREAGAHGPSMRYSGRRSEGCWPLRAATVTPGQAGPLSTVATTQTVDLI
ncbi:PREDICTED: trithorax group protein osa-like [Condylura cristata]|uniref:trithorax group protein osa-like n=1 Tax=Condylura cristata TaxID=143302 RepID=UPI0003346DFC|nr:PREDICTED: trithorax group protein osa-like [Condylura cristata]